MADNSIVEKRKVGRPKGTKNKEGVNVGRPKGSKSKTVEEIKKIRVGFWVSNLEFEEIKKNKDNYSYSEIFFKGLELIKKDS